MTGLTATTAAGPAVLEVGSTPSAWLRTVTFAVTAVGFAVAAHTSAEGRLPRLWLVALALPVVAALVRPLAALEQRLPGLLAGLVALQLGLHAVFVAGAGGRTGGAAGWLCCGSSSPVPLPQTGHLASVALSRAAVVQLLLHLLAAVVLALMLRVQERAVWTTVRAATRRATTALWTAARTLTAALQPALPVPPARPRPVPYRLPVRPAGLLVVRRRARRGPPVGLQLPA